MSETLATQNPTPLKEMPSCTLEMGELRKMNTLEDIPLAEGDSMQQLQTSNQESSEEAERKLKTNSLKRFFRLSPKKKMGDGSLDAGRSEMDIEAKISNSEELSRSFSKSTLKSSLNTYWNSVFKQKKSKKSSKSQMELQTGADEASSSVNPVPSSPNATNDLLENISNTEDKTVLEDIQSLQISEECPQK